MNLPIFYQYPISVTGLMFFGVLLVALEFGFRLGRWWQRSTPDSEKVASGDIALTAMYGLLGLVLALTYSFTVSRADHRKEALIHEANALGTAFLRAGLAPEPERTELRSLLYNYSCSRVVVGKETRTREKRQAFISHSLEFQAELWPAVERLIENSDGGPIEAGIVQSINDVIDAHSLRIAALFDRLPGIVLGMLLLIAGASLAVSGYNRGLAGNMNRARMTVLALVLASVMTTITDFDRSLDGFVQMSQQPLKDGIQDMEKIMQKQENDTPSSLP